MQFPSLDQLGNGTPQYLMVAAIIALLWFGWKVFQKLLELHQQARKEAEEARKNEVIVRERWDIASERFAVAIERNTRAFENAERQLVNTNTVTERAREVLEKFQ
jgi:uncharacterized membrane protein